jgi:hypothetical protein
VEGEITQLIFRPPASTGRKTGQTPSLRADHEKQPAVHVLRPRKPDEST